MFRVELTEVILSEQLATPFTVNIEPLTTVTVGIWSSITMREQHGGEIGSYT